MIEQIEQTPGVSGGAPRIAGRRIRVSEIVLWHLRKNVSVAETARRLELTAAQVHAALSYYYDHSAEIEDELAREQALIAETRVAQSSQ